MFEVLAQMDATTTIGLGTVCVALLGLLSWVVRETITQNRDTGAFIRANTEVMVTLKDDTETAAAKLDAVAAKVCELKELQDGRPCALLHSPDVVEWLRKVRIESAAAHPKT